MRYIELLDKLNTTNWLDDSEIYELLDLFSPSSLNYAKELALNKSLEIFGNNIFYRGIVEFTNICRNNCYYCGLQKANKNISRYRLTQDQILACCANGYEFGMRTFVLQGGEDPSFDNQLTDIICELHQKYSDCAITLGVGEREREIYQKWYDSGADRFLLRHETADKSHYEKLHPDYQKYENRMDCLHILKEIGYQTGAGMMIGSPYQTKKNIADDLIFLRDFKPEMIGIGPFIPHKDTLFKAEKTGDFELTLFSVALVRLLLPHSLIPATTAMDTVRVNGRLETIKAGANVIMLNITPLKERKNYQLYNKMAELDGNNPLDIKRINQKLEKIDYKAVIDRGDFK